MTKLFNTMLLGQEFAAPTVPSRNILGSFHAEYGTFSFWSNSTCILAFPMANVQRMGSDWNRWQKDLVQIGTGFAYAALSLGLVNINRFAYNWLIYYDDRIGGEVEIWLLASNGWLDTREADRRHRLIGEHIVVWREEVRESTRPR